MSKRQYLCEYCGENSQCRVCKSCRRHCRCKECDTCHKPNGNRHHYCRVCEVCRTECVCRQRSGARKFNLPAFSGILNPNPRMVGVELEISEFGEFQNFANPTAYSYSIDHDGSVSPSGQEMVLAPMRGDHLLVGLREVAADLAAFGCKVNGTCGYHVHVDASDYNMFHVRRLLHMYKNIEKELYSTMIPPGRRGSRYCLPLLPQTLKMLTLMDKGQTMHDLKISALMHMYGVTYKQAEKGNVRETIRVANQDWLRLKGNKYLRSDNLRNMRYQGLNLHSWFYRGTIEFRMWPGTVDVEDITMWALWCASVIESAANWTDAYAFSAGWSEIVGAMPKAVQDWVGKVKGRYAQVPLQPPPTQPSSSARISTSGRMTSADLREAYDNFVAAREAMRTSSRTVPPSAWTTPPTPNDDGRVLVYNHALDQWVWQARPITPNEQERSS